MADASQSFEITVPAGNGSTATMETEFDLGSCNVTGCNIVWPAGCSGLVGAALLAAESWAFPAKQGTFWRYDDFVYSFSISNQITTGDWSLVAYNADYYDHTIQVVIEYDYLTSVVSSPMSLQIGV